MGSEEVTRIQRVGREGKEGEKGEKGEKRDECEVGEGKEEETPVLKISSFNRNIHLLTWGENDDNEDENFKIR